VVTIIPDRWTVRPSGAAHPQDQRPRRRDGPSPRYVGYLASSPAGLRRRSITHIRESQMTETTTSSTISRNSGSCEMSTISPVRARDKPVQRRTEAREALRLIYHEVAGVLVDFVLHAVGRDDLNVGADNLGNFEIGSRHRKRQRQEAHSKLRELRPRCLRATSVGNILKSTRRGQHGGCWIPFPQDTPRRPLARPLVMKGGRVNARCPHAADLSRRGEAISAKCSGTLFEREFS
jgi:hypothetical protein